MPTKLQFLSFNLNCYCFCLHLHHRMNIVMFYFPDISTFFFKFYVILLVFGKSVKLVKREKRKTETKQWKFRFISSSLGLVTTIYNWSVVWLLRFFFICFEQNSLCCCRVGIFFFVCLAAINHLLVGLCRCNRLISLYLTTKEILFIVHSIVVVIQY